MQKIKQQVCNIVFNLGVVLKTFPWMFTDFNGSYSKINIHSHVLNFRFVTPTNGREFRRMRAYLAAIRDPLDEINDANYKTQVKKVRENFGV